MRALLLMIFRFLRQKMALREAEFAADPLVIASALAGRRAGGCPTRVIGRAAGTLGW